MLLIRPMIVLWLAGALFAAAPALEQAQQLYAGADYKAAIETLRKAEGKDAAAWALLGKAYYGAGEFKDAHQALEKAVDAAPDNAGYWNWLGRAYGQHADNANPFSAMGLARKCRDAFEKAVELDPENIEALNDLFSYYLSAPGFLGGGVDKAEAIAARVGKLDEAEHEYLQAELAKKHDDYAAAEKHLRRALEFEPQRLGRVLDLAVFLAERGRTEESDQLLERAAKLAPDNPRVPYTRAKALIKADRDPAEARQLLKNYLARNLTSDDPPRWEAEKLLKKVD